LINNVIGLAYMVELAKLAMNVATLSKETTSEGGLYFTALAANHASQNMSPKYKK
jgi:hypothetical protein